jgi:hypothetical protein
MPELEPYPPFIISYFMSFYIVIMFKPTHNYDLNITISPQTVGVQSSSLSLLVSPYYSLYKFYTTYLFPTLENTGQMVFYLAKNVHDVHMFPWGLDNTRSMLPWERYTRTHNIKQYLHYLRLLGFLEKARTIK